MPLQQSASKKAFKKNVETELHANPKMDPKQAVAIAYATKRANDCSPEAKAALASAIKSVLSAL